MAVEDVLINQPVVIDNGSGIVKAGFAGEDQPKSYFPAIVGKPKHTRVMAGAVEGDSFIGNKAQELRGILSINYPMEHGIVTNWANMERIWHHIYSEELKTLPEEHPVLLTEAPINPRKNRDQIAQIFFETFNVPAMFLSIQAVLALYASGRTTGVVLDVGDGVSHTVPVYEGFAIQSAIQRSNVAGRDVTENLSLLLRKQGHYMGTTAEFEIVRMIKEKCCYASLNPAKEGHDFSGKYDTFTLPDGNVIKIGTERILAPEILFNPSLIGVEEVGVHQLVLNSIQRVDLDLRTALYQNIVLSGGTTLTTAFGDRLLQEIKSAAYKDVKIKIYAPKDRKYSTWVGGSILASLSTFKKMWISAEEYHEDSDIIHKKFLN